MRPPRSTDSFESFGFCEKILHAISAAGFDTPRPIQAKTIPEVLKGRDVLGLAQTGTGKTAAFALPIIERLTQTRGENPRALIIAPTRELVLQIHAEIGVLAKFTRIRSTTVFGGVGAAPQIRALRSRPDIIVACPGRLLDLMGSGDASLDGVEVLVLDEADYMLDMGFLPDIKRILAKLPEPRQNLLFSASMPKEIRSLADRLLHNPHVAELNHSAPADTIEHALYPVEKEQKTALLQHLLGQEDFKSAIVFLRTKHRARRLARDLDRAGYHAVALQGNMSQSQRTKAMQGFRDGKFDVLVATDIAARGIDVANVSHVINFDIPGTTDAYTHRIGRTGRAERTGKACTFVTNEDRADIREIERKLKMEIPRVFLEQFGGGRDTHRAESPRSEGRGGNREGGRRPANRAPSARPARGRGGPRGGAPRGGVTLHARTEVPSGERRERATETAAPNRWARGGESRDVRVARPDAARSGTERPRGRSDDRPRSSSNGRSDDRPRSSSDDRPRSSSNGRGEDRPRSSSNGRSDDRPRSSSNGRSDDRPRSSSDDRPRSFSNGRSDDRPRSSSNGRSDDRPRSFNNGRIEDRPRRDRDPARSDEESRNAGPRSRGASGGAGRSRSGASRGRRG